MKKVITILAFVLIGSFANAQANKADVKGLLELTGVTKKYETLLNQVAEQINESSRADFKKDMEGFIQRSNQKMVAFYASKLSQDEVVKLTEFFKSPLGKKYTETVLAQETLSPQESEELQLELQGIIMKYMM